MADLKRKCLALGNMYFLGRAFNSLTFTDARCHTRAASFPPVGLRSDLSWFSIYFLFDFVVFVLVCHIFDSHFLCLPFSHIEILHPD